MNDTALVLPLDADAEIAAVGGKGASLARLARAGLPVPPGFHVTTRAYRAFVSAGLDQEIAAALRETDEDGAAAAIAEGFARRDLPSDTAEAVLAAYTALGGGVVAVRSSATTEDLPDLSFAGQHDTFLGVTGADALLAAVKRCWASLWTARAIGYRSRNGIAPEDVALAVVVQRLVPADAAGVLFTANPLTGARGESVINAAWGLGEAVVGGEVTPDTYVLAHGSRTEKRREVSDKAVMTVRTPEGTATEATPERLRRAPVLDQARAAELAGLGERIHDLYSGPMDVEWTLSGDEFAIVQARPITNLSDEDTAEVWNDSLAGDYLWTCANLGEAIPSVMTPATWSVARALAMPAVGGHPVSGNIGGRFYLNLSVSFGVANALGLGGFARRQGEQLLGRIPDSVAVPPLPMSRPALLRSAVSLAGLALRQTVTYRRRLPALLAETPGRCQELRERIGAAESPEALAALWRSDVADLLRVTCRILESGARQGGPERVRAALVKAAGEADATTLMTGLHEESGAALESLGPVIGLARLRRGEIDRDAYARAWGHRCADEFELSVPRPGEDPAWLDRQPHAPGPDPEDLLRKQAAVRAEAWRRLRQAHPRAARRLRRRVDRAAVAARRRELARSEMVRTFWVLRAFAVRAGELTGHGADVFFLDVDEIVAVLDGDTAPLAAVPARRAAYRRYSALPAYPTLIRGRFDPETWAANPDRRTDLYDETGAHKPLESDSADSADITGSPGAAGVVEGAARVVSTAAEGAALLPGEILVTAVTNIGWTPLFPRAAAVVTDIGAPLSHAAIVARELGIPAVVGCGDATTRLATGDRVRVDGTLGRVTLLDSAQE
ncbi:PEP/pyruvate-binding domain-containing protein [Actinokineospora iranica]|nr:PEP/pyruvate-binding domain-containing protein [Actinokineospora iranica]